MDDSTSEPARSRPDSNVVETWQGYIQGKRWIAGLYTTERQANGDPNLMLFDTIVNLIPGVTGMGVKSCFKPPHATHDEAMKHGRQCLLILGFEPV